MIAQGHHDLLSQLDTDRWHRHKKTADHLKVQTLKNGSSRPEKVSKPFYEELPYLPHQAACLIGALAEVTHRDRPWVGPRPAWLGTAWALSLLSHQLKPSPPWQVHLQQERLGPRKWGTPLLLMKTSTCRNGDYHCISPSLIAFSQRKSAQVITCFFAETKLALSQRKHHKKKDFLIK